MRQVLERMEGVRPVVGKLGAAVEQPLLLIGVERGDAGGGRHRIAGIGVAVGELDEVLGAVHEGVVDLLLHEDRAHRDGAVGDALGGQHDIRHDAEMIDGEGRAEAAEAGDDLVEDEQDAVLVADRAQLLEIALGRHQHAGGAGDRLDDDRGDGRGVVQGDEALKLVGELGAMLGLAAREGVAGEIVGVADVVDAGEQRAEHLAVADDAADRDAAEIDAVIAALAADQAEARALADGALIGERDLEAGLDRLGAGIGEEDVVDAGRHVGDQARRQLEALGMADLEGRRVVELADLIGDRLDDLRPAVAGIDAPQAGGAVQHLAAVGGAVIHALRGDQHARRLLELPVGRERHPEGFEIVGRDLSARHDFSPPAPSPMPPSKMASVRPDRNRADCAGGPFPLGEDGVIS